jgi:hypothetical protein
VYDDSEETSHTMVGRTVSSGFVSVLRVGEDGAIYLDMVGKATPNKETCSLKAALPHCFCNARGSRAAVQLLAPTLDDVGSFVRSTIRCIHPQYPFRRPTFLYYHLHHWSHSNIHNRPSSAVGQGRHNALAFE